MGRLLYWPKVVLTRVLEGVVIVLVALLVLDVLWGVITRFLLREPSLWTQDVATVLLMWVAVLGAAPAFSRHEHLGIDFFTGKLHPAARRLLAIAAHAVVVLFASWAMLYGGWVLVSESLAAGQLNATLQIPVGYLYLPVAISGAAIAIISLQQMGEEISTGDTDHGTPLNEQVEGT